MLVNFVGIWAQKKFILKLWEISKLFWGEFDLSRRMFEVFFYYVFISVPNPNSIYWWPQKSSGGKTSTLLF